MNTRDPDAIREAKLRSARRIRAALATQQIIEQAKRPSGLSDWLRHNERRGNCAP